ncbi:hypothetical protein AB0F64_22590 [Streptomyces sp. NPDC026294]|uniref:hypothetical protein n=1 Tax=Streptomyces sp. NPDC026294 TaxID=3155362 RepID=UPI0033F75F72
MVRTRESVFDDTAQVRVGGRLGIGIGIGIGSTTPHEPRSALYPSWRVRASRRGGRRARSYPRWT